MCIAVGFRGGKAGLETSATAFAQLRGSFAFTAGLGRLIVFATTGLSQNAFLLHFAAKLLEGDLEGAVGVHDNLCHGGYQRDRLEEPVRCPLRGWG